MQLSQPEDAPSSWCLRRVTQVRPTTRSGLGRRGGVGKRGSFARRSPKRATPSLHSGHYRLAHLPSRRVPAKVRWLRHNTGVLNASLKVAGLVARVELLESCRGANRSWLKCYPKNGPPFRHILIERTRHDIVVVPYIDAFTFRSISSRNIYPRTREVTSARPFPRLGGRI